MTQSQPGILQAVPEQAIYVTARLSETTSLEQAIKTLQAIDLGDDVIGLGASLFDRFDQSIAGLESMQAQYAGEVHIPSTGSDLWCWLRGSDQGDLLHRSRSIAKALYPAFEISSVIEAFRHHEGRDLTGYEDGTENPVGDAAIEAAILTSNNKLLDGSSFVAVQQWQHDLDRFESFSTEHQDHIIGRRLSDNEELEDAPESAHVKRTAQESFEPEAFLLRRSMPWVRELNSGLMFVGFGCSFYAFETQLDNMIGKRDRVVDGLFEFSRPITGAYYWCPSTENGQLALSDLIL